MIPKMKYSDVVLQKEPYSMPFEENLPEVVNCSEAVLGKKSIPLEENLPEEVLEEKPIDLPMETGDHPKEEEEKSFDLQKYLEASAEQMVEPREFYLSEYRQKMNEINKKIQSVIGRLAGLSKRCEVPPDE